MKQITFKDSVNIFVEEKKDYYNQWVFDKPVVVSSEHSLKIERLQKIIYKLILFFVNNFQEYQDLIIVSPKTKLICEALSNVNYKVGTYRTDFVFDKHKNPKLIEITCRFALNTIFVSSIYDRLSKDIQKRLLANPNSKSRYNNLISYLEKISGKGDIFILSGEDKKNESILFKEIFERTGRKVTRIYFTDIDSALPGISKDVFIISELTLSEIESLSLDTIVKLSTLNLVNDFRTALLVHDKQFFSVLSNQKFQNACLDSKEQLLLCDFLIPTYNSQESPESWNNAKTNKDKWILKHRALGKSESIYSGAVTEQSEWSRIFEEEDLEQYILQEWVVQPLFESQLKNKTYKDYVTGTYLFFNNNFFGFGPFRTSSHPVTNVVDDRKAIAIIEDGTEKNKINEEECFCFLD